MSWEKESDLSDRRRGLPAGEYLMTGYRLSRASPAGETWWASATATAVRTIAARAGETASVAIDPTVHVRARRSRTSVNVDIRGEGKSGLSLYRAGRRIDIAFRLRDAEGKERAAGTLKYG